MLKKTSAWRPKRANAALDPILQHKFQVQTVENKRCYTAKPLQDQFHLLETIRQFRTLLGVEFVSID